VRLTGRRCTPDQELQEDLIQRRRRASVRCAVTMLPAIIMESGPVRDAKLSSREAFRVTSTILAVLNISMTVFRLQVLSQLSFADIQNTDTKGALCNI